MILAAGLGTRLRPLTHTIPKCLVPVFNRPLVTIILEHLKECGIERAVMNAHHLADEVERFIAGLNPRPAVEISREDNLLDTGGGIYNALDLLGEEPFLVVNGDVLTGFDFRRLAKVHRARNARATMLLSRLSGHNTVPVDEGSEILGFSPEDAPGERLLAYTGIMVMDPEIFLHLPGSGAFSVLEVLRRAMAAGETVAAHVASGFFWAEAGSIEGYMGCHRALARGCPFPALESEGLPVAVHPSAAVGEGVEFSGFVAVGEGAKVGEGARLKDVIVLPGGVVEKKEELSGFIAGPGFRAAEHG